MYNKNFQFKIQDNILYNSFEGSHVISALSVLIFGIIYYIIRGKDKYGNRHFDGLDHRSTILDCLYFSWVSFSTIGYGAIDVLPKSSLSRLFVMIQQSIMMFSVGTFISKILDKLITNYYK